MNIESPKVAIYKCKSISYTTDDGKEHNISLPSKYLKSRDIKDVSSKRTLRQLAKKYNISPDEKLCYTIDENKKYVNKFIKNRVSFSNDQLDLFVNAIYPFYGFRFL